MKLKFSVNNQKLMRQDNICLSGGMANCVECEFAFSDEWRGFEKKAIFSNRNICYHVSMADNKCIVPEKIITDTFGISVFGTLGTGNDYRRITADTVFIEVSENGYVRGKTPPEPSEKTKNKIISQIESSKSEIEKCNQQLKNLREETDAYSASAGADFKKLKNSSKNCIDTVYKITDMAAEIPADYSQNTHTHKIRDIEDMPNIPAKLSDIENDCRYTQDANYVHTDNNFTPEEKQKLEGLNNYDDTTVQHDLKNKMPILKAESTGYPAVIEKQSEGKKLLGCRIYGSDAGVGNYNESTGKYDIPVTVCGKNLIPYPYTRYKYPLTVSGVTFTDKNGILVANGTASASITLWVGAGIPIRKGKYYLSGAPSEISNMNSVFTITVCNKTDTKLVNYLRDKGAGVSVDLTKTKCVSMYYEYAIRISEGVVCDSLIFKPQLEYGTAATKYERYVVPTKATIILDSPLMEGEYVDLIRKKRVNDNMETDIMVEGELKTIASIKNYVTCDTDSAPSRIDVTYQQDAGKVLSELKSAILSLGSNT